MRISEEYLERHKLKTRVYPHIENGAILTQYQEGGQRSWLLTKIQWNHDPTYHPGKYYVSTMKPQHDAMRRSSFFRDVNERETVYWDQYHDRLDHWLKNVDKGSIVHGEREVTLAVWEMFLYCNDSVVARLNNADEKVFPTIDPSKSLDDRFEAFQGLQKSLLHPERGDLARYWQSEFDYNIIRNYVHWLAESAVE